MDAELKTQWIAALRSGDYRQGRGHLSTVDGAFCCLGVLAHLNGWSVDDPEGRADTPVYAPIAEALGSPPNVPDSTLFELIVQNDNGRSFAEIADWIEARL